MHANVIELSMSICDSVVRADRVIVVIVACKCVCISIAVGVFSLFMFSKNV